MKVKEGNRYTRLTAIKLHHLGERNRQYWLYKCDCGKEIVRIISDVNKGSVKSCGCLQKELAREKAKITFTKHGKSKTRIYTSWYNMKTRCTNKNYDSYKNYGGRGITICKRWLKFDNFLKDMIERPKGKSLDRIDNDGDYSKENCKWSTSVEQNNNRRNNLKNNLQLCA